MARKTRLVFRGSEGKQRHAAGSFDGGRQQSLMASAVAGNPARRHFAPFGDKLRNNPEILVIDPQRLIGAETAYFAPEHWPAARRAFLVIRSLPTWSRAPFHLCHSLSYLFLLLSVNTVPDYSAEFSVSAKFGLPFDEINILFDFVAQRLTRLPGGQKPASRYARRGITKRRISGQVVEQHYLFVPAHRALPVA